MGQEESKLTHPEQNESYEIKELQKKIDKEGPAAANAYIEEHMNRWKTETVKLAVSGCSATGKSTFINCLRGVKRGEKGYAEVGFGDTTMVVTPYVQPDNSRIVYYDLPGVGTLEVKKENYISTMKIQDYDLFFIFFDKVITEDNLWLLRELEKLGKPYCFVRSKLDEDISNAERDGLDKESVICKIRQKIKKSVDKNEELKNAKTIFYISCVDPSIGEMRDLLAFVNSNLDKFKAEAVISSIAVLSIDVINVKYENLEKRLTMVSTATAVMYQFIPLPIEDQLQIAFIALETTKYINGFGLGKEKMQALNNFDASKLKCSQIILFSEKDTKAYLKDRLISVSNDMTARNKFVMLIPLVGSCIKSIDCVVIAYNCLRGILEDVRHDAIVVCRHLIEQTRHSCVQK